MGHYLHLGGHCCARRESNPCNPAGGHERAVLFARKGPRVEWHMSCSGNQWLIVTHGTLRTALPILSISGILLWSLVVSAGSELTTDQFNTVLTRFNTSAPPAFTFIWDGTNFVYSDTQRTFGGVMLKPTGNGPFAGVVINHGAGGTASGYSLPKAREMSGWGMVAIGPS